MQWRAERARHKKGKAGNAKSDCYSWDSSRIHRFCAGPFLAFWSVALKLIDRGGHPSFAEAWAITVRIRLYASPWVQISCRPAPTLRL